MLEEIERATQQGFTSEEVNQGKAAWLQSREVTRAQDVRDTLRVCTSYGIPEVVAPSFPPWLAVPADLGALDAKIAILSVLVHQCFAG